MQENLKCPCMPQCPNYGKCRQCIAAHAAYYTVPKCVKLMQEDMKKNHLHPGNPHIRKSLPQRVAEYYEANPVSHLRTAAEALNITQWQLLDAMDGAVAIPVAKFDEVYARLQALEQVMLHLDSGSAVLQLTTALPEPIRRGDAWLLQCRQGDMGLTSLLFPSTLYAVFLVREQLLKGQESLSIALVGEDEKIALSIYLRRGEDGNIQSNVKELFEDLWTKYKNEQE